MLPSRTKEAIDRYVADRCPVGGFLRAVLSNNLTESFGRADQENRNNLYDIVSYCYNNLPAGCWGNPDKVTYWLQGYNPEQDTSGDSG